MNDSTSTRLTYLAWGEFPDEQRAIVHDQFADFHRALQADRTPERAAEAFPPNVRQTAARAATAVRAFEAAIGEKTGAPPTYVSLPGGTGPHSPSASGASMDHGQQPKQRTRLRTLSETS